jgi:hypothetical protein
VGQLSSPKPYLTDAVGKVRCQHWHASTELAAEPGQPGKGCVVTRNMCIKPRQIGMQFQIYEAQSTNTAMVNAATVI